MRRAASALALLLAATVACGDDGAKPGPGATSAGATSPATSATATNPASSPSPDEQVIEVSYAGGTVTRPARRVQVRKGRRVRLVVTSDVADDVHLHAPYDLTAAVAPGQPGIIAFTATIATVVTAELHEAGEDLVELEIR